MGLAFLFSLPDGLCPGALNGSCLNSSATLDWASRKLIAIFIQDDATPTAPNRALESGSSQTSSGGGVTVASSRSAGFKGDVLASPSSDVVTLDGRGTLDGPLAEKRRKWDDLDAFYGDDDDDDGNTDESEDTETEDEGEEEDENDGSDDVDEEDDKDDVVNQSSVVTSANH